MSQVPLEIANWEEGFEIAQSRRRSGRLSWVAMPTRHDSRGYRRLIRSDGGVRHFACWCVLVQVAARCSIRGVLADDRGIALTFDDFEALTDIPASYFESAIPILCDIGWLLCPKSETSRSVVGDCSEIGMSTVQNKTVQDKTKQYITGLKNQHRSIQTKEAKLQFDKIPSKRRRGYKSFCNAFISEVFEYDVDPEFAIEAVLAYYESPEGKCHYFREPTRLIDDHIWEEDRESWTRKERGEQPPVDESVTQEAFERIFDGKDVL